MKKVDLDKTKRGHHYAFFKSFSNTTYGMTVRIDVTPLVVYVKKNKISFFSSALYLLVKSLNEIDEMRMRLVNDEPVIFDIINPSYTVRTKSNAYDNVRQKYEDDFEEFYNESREIIKSAYEEEYTSSYDAQSTIYDEYYVACTPEMDFAAVTHPIPDDKTSQSIPRICFGKYILEGDRYKMALNITVSHMFVDGYPLTQAFNKFQEYINNSEKVLTLDKKKRRFIWDK